MGAMQSIHGQAGAAYGKQQEEQQPLSHALCSMLSTLRPLS